MDSQIYSSPAQEHLDAFTITSSVVCAGRSCFMQIWNATDLGVTYLYVSLFTRFLQ